MSVAKAVTQHKSAPVFGFKALPGEAEGTFEAIVAVFGNVDFAKERIVAGAFAKSLAAWQSSGDPVPVIFSHQWENLDAHVGVVLEARELAPGDSALPGELSSLGGLYVKARMDVDEDFAGRLWKRLDRRSIKEFSFAYDVLAARPGAGGALDLLELDLIEVGPTLKGMNPATALIGAKNAPGPLEALETADAIADALVELETDDAGEKRLPAGALDGSIEAGLVAVRESAAVWAELEYGRDLYWLHVEATFPDDGRVIVTAERWEDPLGEGPVWELNYSSDADGLVTIDDATELELTVELKPKSRLAMLDRMAWKAAGLAGFRANDASSSPSGVTIPASDGKASDDPATGKAAEDSTTESGTLSPAMAAAQAELIVLE